MNGYFTIANIEVHGSEIRIGYPFPYQQLESSY